MTNKKLISFAIALASVTGVAVAAATSQSPLLFRTGATYEPYYCIYGDIFAEVVQDETDSNVSYARSRELTLGFNNFTSGGDTYLKYESDNNIAEESQMNPLEYASFWNVEPVHGLLGGSVITKPMFEEDGETEKAFHVYAIFSDQPMSNVNDPIKAALSSPTGLFGIMFDYNYGLLSGSNIHGGEPCSVVPEDLDTPIEIFVGDGEDPETHRFGDVLRYLGSFEYFFIAFYGNVAIDTITIAYTCEAMPDTLIYEPYPCSHSEQTLTHNATSHWYQCDDCGEKINEQEHTYAYDGYCSECDYYNSAYDNSYYEE